MKQVFEVYILQRHLFVIQNVEFGDDTRTCMQSFIHSVEYFILRDMYVAFMKAHDSLIKTLIMAKI